MRLKWLKFMAALKKNTWKAVQTLLTPLANLEMKIINNNSSRMKKKCQKITDDELMERFAKYIVKDLLKDRGRTNEYKEFMVFDKGAYKYATHDEFEERILYGLHNIAHSCKDKVLKNWKYHGEKAKLYYSFKDEDNLKMIVYEKELNFLLKEKLNALGIYAEYEDRRKDGHSWKVNEYWQVDKYDFYGKWLDKIGYEKSLIVRLN